MPECVRIARKQTYLVMTTPRTRAVGLRSPPDGGEREGVVWPRVRPGRVRDKHAGCEDRQWQARPGGDAKATMNTRCRQDWVPGMRILPRRTSFTCTSTCARSPPLVFAVRECPACLRQPPRFGGASGMAFAGPHLGCDPGLSCNTHEERLVSALVAGTGGTPAPMRALSLDADARLPRTGQALTEELVTQRMK